nr:uncharacterized protein LOC112544605 [Pelodiscus sinensis]|eukprot:XP_025036877.1 uncharacterized protein LOC112544605 [Pelodiscus sinensis]
MMKPRPGGSREARRLRKKAQGMDPAQVLEWMKAAHRESQQQQTALIQQLSTQHQEHQRQLLKELAEQFKEQTRLSMAQIPAAAAREDDSEEMGEAGPRPSIRLTKMGATDDPEAYLTTFERVATTARWPESHWATILAPYLTGQAQLAYRSLSDRDALHYYKVKEAILDQMGITPETYRQKFRGEQYSPGTRPRVVAQRLREAAWRWLDPEQRTGPQVAELVVLEQFINILPSGGARWVRRHHPSTLSEAIELMNDYEAAEGEVPKGTISGTLAEDRSGDHWRRPGHYRRGKANEREVDVRWDLA